MHGNDMVSVLVALTSLFYIILMPVANVLQWAYMIHDLNLICINVDLIYVDGFLWNLHFK